MPMMIARKNECRTEVVLQDDQKERRRRPHGDLQQQVHVGLFGPVINLHIVFGDDPRQHDDERNFHDFGRLKSDPTEAEPTFCPLEIVSIAVIEDQDQEQKQDAGPICGSGQLSKVVQNRNASRWRRR